MKLHRYRSDAWDAGNSLTHFIEYHHPCPVCGDDVTTYDTCDEQLPCLCCEEQKELRKRIIDWFRDEDNLVVWITRLSGPQVAFTLLVISSAWLGGNYLNDYRKE